MPAELQTLVSTEEPPIVFVSYSHKDEEWKDRFLPHLESLGRLGMLSVWDDRQIKAGVDWYAKIHDVLSKTKVAVCLISTDFLNSSFCLDEEIPYLLQRRNRGDLEIFPILLRECVREDHRWLKRLQMLPVDGKPIATHFSHDPDPEFAKAARQVRDFLRSGEAWKRPEPKGPKPKVDITRLPQTDDLLFGRTKELNFLDQTWNDNSLNVAVLKASGGVGKSSLVRCWVEDMALDNYRGARRVFAWSFYSQGTQERVTSADEFLVKALEWFGDASRGEGLSPWDRGKRLAELVRDERNLLLLDGLEPLQSGQAFDRGKVKDPGLETLLFELARENPGLCLISTREQVSDLWHADDEVSIEQFDLDTIAPIAGRALLRVGGIAGEDEELESAVRDFGQHAFAVKLLGNYLRDGGQPHIKHAAAIQDLPAVAVKDGKHPRRVMAAFAERFGESAKAEILAMLGLFDRPADEGSIEALRAAPSVTRLNAAVRALGSLQWQDHVEELRRLGLLSPASHHNPDELDAHPLVREHFAEHLQTKHPEAWQAGHLRLYEHLQTVPQEDQPDGLAEMAPLFQAVHHGCAAGRYQEALDGIYYARIVREQEFYLWKRLGAVSADLGVITSFFDSPWERPVASLSEADQAWLLNEAATRLRLLGRLRDAVAPNRAGLERRVDQRAWQNAANSALNLSELHLTLGEIAEAVALGEESLAHAEQSGEDFQRIVTRTTLADARHRQGDLQAAKALFEDAEAMQAKVQPNYLKLYAFQGYQYCDLLLALGGAQEVRERARQALEWAMINRFSLVTIALDHLSLGRAALALGDRAEARTQLDEAVDDLRASGNLHYLPLGLLARAMLFRETDDLDKARGNLDEAMRIARRGEMRLHQCDAHLEYARLALAEGDRDRARKDLERADALINECGYHRRDAEVEELKRELMSSRPATT